MSKKLLLPEDAKALLSTRFTNQHRNWLAGEGAWPFVVSLGMPTEKDIVSDTAGVRRWTEAWTAYAGPGTLAWEDRAYGRLGRHRFPGGLALASPEAVASAVSQSQSARWKTAAERHARLVAQWPGLGTSSVLRRNYDVLADYSNADFERLVRLVGWVEANPASGHYLRQLPVEGLDTKWIEPRRGLVMDVLQGIRGDGAPRDFYDMCGLQRPPHRLRVRVLCPELRKHIGGLRDFEAPSEEVALLPIRPRTVVVVENQETGVALPDIPGCVALMKLGNAVNVLHKLTWLHGADAVYWGDVDTHGYAILDRARAVLPGLRSVLMDERTLLSHLNLAGEEKVQCPPTPMTRLTPEELAVYDGLRTHRWGQNLRLEQERLPFSLGVAAIELAAAVATAGGTEPDISI